MSQEELSNNIAGIAVCIVVFAVIAIPIFYGLTTEPYTNVNEDAIGELRLGYQEQVFREEIIEAETEEEEDEVILVDITSYVAKSYLFTINGDTVSVSGDWTGELSLSDNQIIIGSDNYQLTIQYGKLIESVGGYGVEVFSSLQVSIHDGSVNDIPYTFLYYPDAKGPYANYQSYQYDITDHYSVGTFAGVTVSAINDEVKGDNQYGFGAETQTEDGTTTGVVYSPRTEEQTES